MAELLETKKNHGNAQHVNPLPLSSKEEFMHDIYDRELTGEAKMNWAQVASDILCSTNSGCGCTSYGMPHRT